MRLDRKKFFDGIRQGPFSNKLTKSQVDGVNILLDEAERRELEDPRWLADILGQIKWETAHTMQPIRESGSLTYLKSKRYYPWFGRGFIQLTWRDNYAAFQKEVLSLFDLDILANPDAALDPQVAAYIAFEGMIEGRFAKDRRDGKPAKLAKYFNDTTTDWLNARRIVNGMDRAAEIAAIAKQFYSDILAAKE